MKTVVLQNNFASGVFEPRLKGRTDIPQYAKALEIGENCITIPLGGVKRRPGLTYIDQLPNKLVEINATPTMPEGGTDTNINDFDYETSTQTTGLIGVVDPYVVAQYDLGSPTQVDFLDVIGISLSNDSSSDEFFVQWSNDGSTWNNLLNLGKVDTSTRNYRASGIEAQYFRLAKIGGNDLGSNLVNIAGFWLYSEGDRGNCRLIDFAVSDADSFLLVLTDRCISIYENDILLTLLPSKFTDADLQTVDGARTDYVMLLVQENVQPQRLIYDTTDDLFLIDDIPFSTVPKFDYNDSLSPTPIQAQYEITFGGLNNGQLFRLRLEGFETEEIVYEGDTTQATADGIERALSGLPIVGAGGVTVDTTSPLTITFSDSSTDDFQLFTGYVTTGDAADTVTLTNIVQGSPRKEDVWSEDRGYPRTICFYQNRLWFGGSKSKPQSLFGSRTNSFFDFQIDVGLPTDPIFVTLDAKRRNSITSIVPSRRLAIFTDGSEFVSNEGAITPENIAIDAQTSYGSSFVRPVDVEGNIIYIDRVSSTLRGFLFDFGEDGFRSNNLSLLSSHLIKSPIDMSFSVGAADEDSIYVFIVNDDGTAAVYNTLRTQEISNFTEFTTDGSIIASEGISENVYFAVSRDLAEDGLYLERFDVETYTDANIYQDLGAPSTTVTGLDHLDGIECRVRADGFVVDNATPTNGEITLVNEAQIVEVGVNMPANIQMMPLAPPLGVTNGVMHKKKIARQHYMVFETLGMVIDGRVIPQKSFADAGPDSPLGQPSTPYTGLIRNIEGQLGWDSTLAPVVSFPDPTPFTILAIETELEVS